MKSLCRFASVGLFVALMSPNSGRCQISPSQAGQIRTVASERIEALTLFGGDYLFGGGSFHSTGNGVNHLDLEMSKFGGSGEFSDLRQLGDLPVAWRPMLMGNMGVVDAKNRYTSGLLAGDLSETKSFAVQFGGGARFWFTDEFSAAPTITGMYGHTTNEYTAESVFMKTHLPTAMEIGLVDWSADSWTVRPAANLQYEYTWDRTLITLSSDAVFFHTESFKSSNSNLSFRGNSQIIDSKFDVDIPLGHSLFGHELRTGGYFERTNLYGNLREGLNTGYFNDIHARLVLDYLTELPLTQWIGIGGSYYWGSNFTGWSAGIDFLMVF